MQVHQCTDAPDQCVQAALPAMTFAQEKCGGAVSRATAAMQLGGGASALSSPPPRQVLTVVVGAGSGGGRSGCPGKGIQPLRATRERGAPGQSWARTTNEIARKAPTRFPGDDPAKPSLVQEAGRSLQPGRSRPQPAGHRQAQAPGGALLPLHPPLQPCLANLAKFRCSSPEAVKRFLLSRPVQPTSFGPVRFDAYGDNKAGFHLFPADADQEP